MYKLFIIIFLGNKCYSYLVIISHFVAKKFKLLAKLQSGKLAQRFFSQKQYAQ